jgi:methylthioribose-1-phosphate isomerase
VEYNGTNYRTVWMEGSSVHYIEQNLLPFEFRVKTAQTYEQCCVAIKEMEIRGAGAIGAMGGFAMALAFSDPRNLPGSDFTLKARATIDLTRPTARNLFYATEKVFSAGHISTETANLAAQAIADKDAQDSLAIGTYGNDLIKEGFRILTHCNAGWLAFVDFGTALSPIYKAHEEGKNIFVFSDETRPRGQGARLTAWELHQAGIPHAIIPDNAAAHYMASGKIDMVIVGADRIARNGDVANKIGTLEKAIVAKEFGVPFYVAAPISTFDPHSASLHDFIIEERNENEVLYQEGIDTSGKITTIRVASPGSHALNPAFDATPAKYITGIITEVGIIKPDPDSIGRILLD